MKTCTSCNVEKDYSEFYASTSKKSGYKSNCKECVKTRANVYYRTDKGRKYIQEKQWRVKGIDMTVERYQELLDAQKNGCGICGVEKNRNGSRLCVDHDHNTGKIRGLLCHHCNTALGKMQDSEEMLMKAIEYLRSHKEAA